MADFIKIEPSTDIHLVLDPNFKDDMNVSLNNLPLKIWKLTDSNSIPNIGSGFKLEDIIAGGGHCDFDFYPVGQTFVEIVGTVLKPKNKGTAFMQVRFTDGPDYYHYLIVRIMVHERMNGWWFGHEDDRMSVFKDDKLPHSQSSIYASFDSDNIIGDITAHNYVKLVSENLATVEVANDVAKPYRGRIRGVTVGTGKVAGTLLGKTKKMDVQVVDFAVVDNRILDLKWGDFVIPPKYKHNMLFIGEGFKGSTKLDEVVTKTIDTLFNQSRHSPYNLLKDDFNVWSVFQNSHHEGITTASLITEDGFPFPFFDRTDSDELVEISDSTAPNGKRKAYTLKKLCELVGFSDKGLRQRGVTNENKDAKIAEIIAQLKIEWENDPVAILLGYDKKYLPQDTVFSNKDGVWAILSWIRQTPMSLIPEVKDTFYGFAAGNRQAEVVSKKEKLAKKITHNSPIVDFTRRMRQWFVPNESNWNFPSGIDSRRISPEISNHGSNWISYFIEKHISQLNTKFVVPGETSILGKSWGYDFKPSNILLPEIKSAGLVCFLINSTLHGRSENYPGQFIKAIIGKNSSVINLAVASSDITIEIEGDGIRRLKVHPETKAITDASIAMIAHEFGHSFMLGDEYEEFHKNADRDEIDYADNLVHFNDIKKTTSPLPNLPKPIDPEKIKWSVLHRTQLSAKIIENSTITNPHEIKVKVSEKDVGKCKVLEEKNKKVIIRKMIINFELQGSKQLRADADSTKRKDFFENLVITNISPENIITLSSSNTLNIAGAEAKQIPAGSILYLPKMYEDGTTPFTLIEKEVMNFMKTEKYDASLPAGRALSENFNKDNTPKLDEVNNETDYPPDITGFYKPCNDYKMIGAYEGGGTFVGDAYRPTGACKMREQDKEKGEGEFCYVCKYLIVSRVNPSKLAKLDEEYPESIERSRLRRTLLDITLYPYHLVRNLM